MIMKRLLIVLFTVIVLVSCSNEPEIDYHALASEAKLEFMQKGILVGDPSIKGDSVTFSIMLLKSESAYILEGKASKNPIISALWSIQTQTKEVFGKRVPSDEEKRKDMALVWVHNYLIKEA